MTPYLLIIALGVALCLMLVDLFLTVNWLRHIAYVVISLVVAAQMPSILQIQFMVVLATWIGMLLFDYYIWSTVSDFVNAPETVSREMQGKVGKIGVIVEKRRRKYLVLEEETFGVMNPQRVVSGQRVRVVSIGDAGFHVAPLENSVRDQEQEA